MRRDSLVHVAATGGYGSVFEAHDGVCEVGLIDPTADEYSITVPQSAVQEMDPVGDSARAGLLGHLVLFHLRVNWRLRLALSFEAFAGREEDGALELWAACGTSRPRRVATLSAREESHLTTSLAALSLDAWAPGQAGAAPSLDGWGWSTELVGAGVGQSACGSCPSGEKDGQPLPPGAVPEGLPAVVEALAGLGLPVAWTERGPRATGAPLPQAPQPEDDAGESEGPALPFDLGALGL